jgi:hypothetical protein
MHRKRKIPRDGPPFGVPDDVNRGRYEQIQKRLGSTLGNSNGCSSRFGDERMRRILWHEFTDDYSGQRPDR